jgi:hypothetical protein
MKIYQKIIKCTEYNHICIYLKTELFTGTVPANKNYVTGTVKNGYVPKKMYIAMDPRVVRTPRYKNCVQSFRGSTRAASIVDLYLGLLYHSAAGLSWLNIRIF